jgi:hypothetical protein
VSYTSSFQNVAKSDDVRLGVARQMFPEVSPGLVLVRTFNSAFPGKGTEGWRHHISGGEPHLMPPGRSGSYPAECLVIPVGIPGLPVVAAQNRTNNNGTYLNLGLPFRTGILAVSMKFATRSIGGGSGGVAQSSLGFDIQSGDDTVRGFPEVQFAQLGSGAPGIKLKTDNSSAFVDLKGTNGAGQTLTNPVFPGQTNVGKGTLLGENEGKKNFNDVLFAIDLERLLAGQDCYYYLNVNGYSWDLRGLRYDLGGVPTLFGRGAQPPQEGTIQDSFANAMNVAINAYRTSTVGATKAGTHYSRDHVVSWHPEGWLS